jgi:hephaestin
MRALVTVAAGAAGAAGEGLPAVLGAAGGVNATAAVPLPAGLEGATTREYFVAAEERLWDYAPLAADNCTLDAAAPLTDGQALFLRKTESAIGRVYKKARFIRYTDGSFATEVEAPAWHGLQGPVLAAEVGNVLAISFYNNATIPATLTLDGGLVPLPGSADPRAAVAPGSKAAYRLYVPASAGPGAADLSTVAYVYASAADPAGDPNAGLVGVALIGAKGAFAGMDAAVMPAAPAPAGTDLLLPILVAIQDENASPYLADNMVAAGLVDAAGAADKALMGDDTFAESNLKHALSGFMFCNAPDVPVAVGQRVRVATATVGNDEAHLHSMQFRGQVLEGAPAGAARGAMDPLMPGSAMVADLAPPAAGRWNFACQIHDHIEAGMQSALWVE